MPEWLQRAIFYEIYPQSFCDGNGDGIGDIRGMRSKLGYIRDLGADAIWLNPIFDSPFMDAGYDVRDYTKVAPRYGTNEELIEFFAEAHRVGIRVLLDLVPGHTSNEHPWFLQSSSASPNEMSGRYIWTDSVWEAPPQYKFVCGMFERDGNSMVNFFSSQPALNYGFREITHPWQCPPDHADALATREAIKDVMRFWLNAGCDGFRVDMADSLIKNDEDKTATSVVWQDIRAMLDRDYPEAALISEWSCPQRAIPAGFHADFYLDHVGKGYHRVFRAVDSVTRKPQGYFAREGRNGFRQFAAEFMEDYLAVHEKGYISLISGNHDTPRLAKFLSPEERKLAFFFLLTMPGVPFIYYGDEVGLLGETDPDCRRCMPWDAQQWNPAVVALYRRLIALRQAHPALRRGNPESLAYFNGLYAYRQAYAGDEALVVLNAREGIAHIRIPTHSASGLWREYASGQVLPAVDGSLDFDFIPAQSAQVFVPVEEKRPG